MKRSAIILDKNLSIGQAANVSAILMGQLALKEKSIYSDTPPVDKDGLSHSAIAYSTVALKANGPTQISNFCKKIIADNKFKLFAFSKTGQGLNNAYSEYESLVTQKTSEDLGLVGCIIYGEDDDIRASTKKFSVL